VLNLVADIALRVALFSVTWCAVVWADRIDEGADACVARSVRFNLPREPNMNDAAQYEVTSHDATTVRLPPQSGSPRNFSRFIIDHNPFFLLSGVSMLLGCFLINAAAHEQQDAINLIVGLLGVFNVYELLVIALGLFLIRSRGMVRDGAYLLLLEVLLLSDLTFLYTEVFTANAYIGTVAAAIGFTLAIVKFLAIFHVMRMRLSMHEWAMLVATFFTLFAMPGVLRHYGFYDMVTPLLLHAGWWIAGILLAAMALRTTKKAAADDASTHRLKIALRIGVALVPWLSIVAHLASAHYVYEAAFLPANLAPLALGGAALLLRTCHRFTHPRAVRFATIALCVVGIALTLPTTPELYHDMTWPTQWTLSPFRGATAISCVIGLVGMMAVGGWVMPAFSAATSCASVLGHDGGSASDAVNLLAWASRRWIGDAAPSGMMGWGILGVIGAFIFLGVGTAMSLRKPPAGSGGGGDAQGGGQPIASEGAGNAGVISDGARRDDSRAGDGGHGSRARSFHHVHQCGDCLCVDRGQTIAAHAGSAAHAHNRGLEFHRLLQRVARQRSSQCQRFTHRDELLIHHCQFGWRQKVEQPLAILHRCVDEQACGAILEHPVEHVLYGRRFRTLGVGVCDDHRVRLHGFIHHQRGEQSGQSMTPVVRPRHARQRDLRKRNALGQ
jgi:hypothetical protein